MSITKKWFFLFSVALIEASLLVLVCSAQDLEATIKIKSGIEKSIMIEGKLLDENSIKATKNWVFVRSVAGIEGLGERISELNLTDKLGEKVDFKKLIAGEYLADRTVDIFQYEVEISIPKNFLSKAHISWLQDERGILMLGDLLPQFNSTNENTSARIKFELPVGWEIISNEKRISGNIFEVVNIDKAIFVIGKNWRENKGTFESLDYQVTTFGEWRFYDEEALEMVGDILKSYIEIFGAMPNNKIQINLIPVENKFGSWQAETRGNTLTIVSGDMPFKTRSLQRLHEQLRHELFHLWIPNNLALRGNYDWFYEGFTVYQSLRTAVKMNRIRFEDFLDTLAQAHKLANFQEQEMSLVEASRQLPSGANPSVYSKGMIAAFLCDAALLQKSKGKRSISDIFRQIYQKHHLPGERQDANQAILGILKQSPELHPIVEKYIEGTEKIVWAKYLDAFGIVSTENNFSTKLEVKTKLNGRQKDLLNELGYNNWRKNYKN